MWMISTLTLTPVIGRVDRLMRRRSKLVTVIPSAALVGAFGYLVSQEPAKSSTHLSVLLVASATAVVLQLLGARTQRTWIQEWTLALSMTAGLVTAGLLS
jgi:hypothetical protein